MSSGEPRNYLALLGISVEATEGEAVLRMSCAPRLLGYGALHGGAISTLLQSAASYELARWSQTERGARLISFSAEYLRAGKGVDTFAAASITRRGRRIASLTVQAWQEDRASPIATAHASFALEGVGQEGA